MPRRPRRNHTPVFKSNVALAAIKAGLIIGRPNQVYAMDNTYIPMARGFVYLVAVLDWCSHKILSWRISITMDVHGVREIVNTDQGSQFTSQAFTGLLKKERHPHQHGRQRRLA